MPSLPSFFSGPDAESTQSNEGISSTSQRNQMETVWKRGMVPMLCKVIIRL